MIEKTLPGVPMYSCLKEVHAKSRDEALTKVPKQFDAPTFAPAVAVRWPESEQDDDEKAWLRKHVGSEWRSI